MEIINKNDSKPQFISWFQVVKNTTKNTNIYSQQIYIFITYELYLDNVVCNQ